MASSSSTRWRAGVARADARRGRWRRARRAGRRRRAGGGGGAPSRRRRAATRKSSPGRNRPSASSHGAQTSGMPQASASKTRMVGMPGSCVDVEAPRHVHGGEVAGEDLRRAGVRQPAAVAGAVALRASSSAVAGIADAVDVERQARGLRPAPSGRSRARRCARRRPSCRSRRGRRAAAARAGGWKSVASAASCQTKTRSPQPQRR